QYQNIKTLRRNHNSVETYTSRNSINRFTQVTDDGLIYPYPKGGRLGLETGMQQEHSGRLQMKFSRAWSGLHELTALAGSELRQSKTNGYNQMVYGYDDSRLTYTDIDMVNL